MTWLTKVLVPVARAPDDRGRLVRLADSFAGRESLTIRHAPTAEVVRTAFSPVLHQSAWIAGALVFGAMTAAGLLHGSAWGWRRWVASILLVLAISPVFRIVQALLVRRSASGIIARLRSHALCAGCLYDLVGLPVDSDGCAVCPECGAAWRATAFTRREPISPRPGAPEARRRAVADAFAGRGGGGWEFDVLNRRVSVQPEALATLASTEGNATHKARLERVAARVGWRRRLKRRERWWIVGLASFFVVVCVVLLATNSAAAPFVVGCFVLAGLPLVVVGYAVIASMSMAGGRRETFMVDTCLAEAVCPVCMGNLSAVEPTERGVVHCPGCAAAWKIGGGARTPWNLERGCPNCRYDLRGLTPDADRTIRCPECGGAWPAAPGALPLRPEQSA